MKTRKRQKREYSAGKVGRGMTRKVRARKRKQSKGRARRGKRLKYRLKMGRDGKKWRAALRQAHEATLLTVRGQLEVNLVRSYFSFV